MVWWYCYGRETGGGGGRGFPAVLPLPVTTPLDWTEAKGDGLNAEIRSFMNHGKGLGRHQRPVQYY